MSRVVRVHEIGGPEVLKIDDINVPAPMDDEVRIRVKATALNRVDVMLRTGTYVFMPTLPAPIGQEAAGTIEAVGKEIKDFAIGDVVSIIPRKANVKYGFHAELANVPAASVIKHPPSWPWQETAATWMSYLTAYSALIDVANLRWGDVVLIPAASSSVGLAAIQIANLVGAVPVALTRGSGKRSKLLAAGAAHVIATDEKDVVEEVKWITNGKGARLAFDSIGGAQAGKLLQTLEPYGIYFLYGKLDDSPVQIPPDILTVKSLTARGSMIYETTDDPVRLPKAVTFISKGIEAGKLKPLIARTFKLDEIVEAYRYMESGEHIGKIVLTV